MHDKLASATVRVWDPFVRAGHWILAAAFFVAYFSEDDFLSLHVWAGYAAGAVILLRILWGFFGTKHARFRDFVCSPRQSLGYFLSLLRGRSRRFVGHSPAGAAMVVLLLLGVAATGWTGLMVYAYEEQAGPLVSFALPAAAAGTPAMQDERFAAREEFWEEAHEILANLTLLLVLLHVAGVLLASRVHHENLVRSMFTGRKRAADPD
jgi:cytochrome b